MNDELNDMINAGSGNEQDKRAEKHLRGLMTDAELSSLRNELPAEFLSDAAEGLGHLPNTAQIQAVVNQLNKHIRTQLIHKKTKRRRRKLGDMSWTYWAIIVILLITVIAFVVIRITLKHL